MFSIEVSSNISKLTDKINAAKPQIELAIVRALNKTATWLKLQAGREISQR